MLRAASTLIFAASAALLAGLACGSDDDRKDGAEGIAEAFHELAEHECRCLAEANGLGSEIEDACGDHVGDIEDFFPASCIEAVIDRHPEARPAYDCAADITYDYVECIIGAGCSDTAAEPSDGVEACDAILQSAATQCPLPPEDISDEIEACFQCDDGNASRESVGCERAGRWPPARAPASNR